MRIYIALIAVMVVAANSRSQDWPQWNGPQRTGAYSEANLLQSIPKNGLKKRWSAEVSLGYSGPAVAGGRVFVTDYERTEGEITNNPGGRDKLSGRERLLCFDAKNGKPLWQHAYARDYYISYPSGPRVTPTVDGNHVYSLGAEGDLLCCDVTDGDVIWQHQLNLEYKTSSPLWGHSASPIVFGDLLITLAGGEGSMVVAFNKFDGKEVWRSLTTEEIGYSPPALIEDDGLRQLLVWSPTHIHSLDPQTGKELWREPLQPQYGMSIMPPVRSGDRLFASGIGEVAGMYQILPNRGGLKQLWSGGDRKTAVYCANATPVFDGDYIYGADCGSGALICVRASDGKRMWETYEPTSKTDRRASHGTAFLSKVSDRYFIFSETGDFIIAKLSPKGYEELGRSHILDPTNECFGRKVVWSYPAYAQRSIFARNDRELVCYSLEGE